MRKKINKIRLLSEKDFDDFKLGVFALITLVLFIPILTFLLFSKYLDNPEAIMNKNDTGITLLDGKGRPFFTFYKARYKRIIPLSDIGPYTKHAVVAMEDKDFYSHPGFSAKAMIRSLLYDLKQGKFAYGGSTITQQLVKNSLLSPKKSILRKYQEFILAVEIERRYSKDKILTMYLNSVYFGKGAFGIEEAAQTYFGKKAGDLDLAQSSFLASLLPSPSAYSFESDWDKLKTRQIEVLKRMTNQKYISTDEASKAEKEKIIFKKNEVMNTLAPHFALLVRDELVKKFGEETVSRSGFRVKTTLDLDWQRYAETQIQNQVQRLTPNNVSNGSAVVIDPKTGAIRVLVGSYDWYDNVFGKVNVATSLRQPGSAFKPIVYAKGLEDEIITPASILKDEPTTYKIEGKIYNPKNYDNKFRGRVLVRRALANSLNVPAVELINKVGVNKSLAMAHRLGINSLDDSSYYGLALVLGGGEVSLLDMTSVYSVFANQGLRNNPVSILEIRDKFNNEVFRFKPEPKSVLSKDTSFLISSILSDNKARAEVFGNTLTISRPAAVKTGTTEDYRDSWTIGYTPSLAIGVWVGNNDNSPMDHVAGSLGAAPVWRSLMEKFSEGKSLEKFEQPHDIVAVSICPYNGLLIKNATNSAVKEFFIRGTEPKKYCPSSAPPSFLLSNELPSISPSSTSSAIPSP